MEAFATTIVLATLIFAVLVIVALGVGLSLFLQSQEISWGYAAARIGLIGSFLLILASVGTGKPAEVMTGIFVGVVCIAFIDFVMHRRRTTTPWLVSYVIWTALVAIGALELAISGSLVAVVQVMLGLLTFYLGIRVFATVIAMVS